MKIHFIKKLFLLLFAFFTICLSVIAKAPGGEDDSDGNGTGGGGSSDVPFDFGLTTMIAAGAIYAAKKGISKRKESLTSTVKN